MRTAHVHHPAFHRRPHTPRFNPLWLRVRACIVWLPVLLLAGNRAEANERHETTLDARIQGLVDDLRAQLSIPQTVTVSLVAKNPLMASVESAKGHDAFVLSLESAFVDELSEDELRAVVAHELGHVSIFTHHPYLQTERLANQIAMRLVSRETLEKVYDKVWRDGVKGDRVRFLGEPPQKVAEAVQVAAAPR